LLQPVNHHKAILFCSQNVYFHLAELLTSTSYGLILNHTASASNSVYA